jgi:hypothetical protein
MGTSLDLGWSGLRSEFGTSAGERIPKVEEDAGVGSSRGTAKEDRGRSRSASGEVEEEARELKGRNRGSRRATGVPEAKARSALDPSDMRTGICVGLSSS